MLDVQRALAAMEKSDDVEALRSGVLLISQKFTEALRQKGVTEIEVLDKEFDAIPESPSETRLPISFSASGSVSLEYRIRAFR